MFKVKLSFPYPDWDIKRQSPNCLGEWGNYKFFINEHIEECDFWFVFNTLLDEKESVICSSKNTVLLTGEPKSIESYDKLFLNQFNHIITSHTNIKHRNITYFHQGQPYFVGAKYRNGRYVSFSKDYDELVKTKNIPKDKLISIITSDKAFTEGHIKRLEFCYKLKDYFGDGLDLFGRGINDFQDKWDVISNYKYSITIENSSIPDYFTEKISDCFLAHTYPIYYGCTNIQRYFRSKSFTNINVENLDESKKTIELILNNKNHYSESLPYIMESKERCLNEYNIFPLMVNFIETKLNHKLAKEKIKIKKNPNWTQLFNK